MHSRFSKKLEQERKKHGWSHNYIAEQLGIDPKTVSRWTRGKNLPQISLHSKIATLLGSTIEDLGLLSNDDDPHSLFDEETTSTIKMSDERDQQSHQPAIHTDWRYEHRLHIIRKHLRVKGQRHAVQQEHLILFVPSVLVVRPERLFLHLEQGVPGTARALAPARALPAARWMFDVRGGVAWSHRGKSALPAANVRSWSRPSQA